MWVSPRRPTWSSSDSYEAGSAPRPENVQRRGYDNRPGALPGAPGAPDDVVAVTSTEPNLDGAGDLAYFIELLDRLGRPLSPISVCGFRRRERRHVRRRAP